jgi:hypothetical protein
MNPMKNKILLLFIFSFSFLMKGQEALRPLSANLQLIYPDSKNSFAKNNFLAAKGIETGVVTPSPNPPPPPPPSLNLPFKEDFFYASTSNFPDQTLWSDSGTYVNNGHAIAPPSIGVATFDGLNKKGYPYTPNALNMSAASPADTLTSKPINLFTSGTQTYQPSDSIALTFYYEARGFGDSPELIDSLLVDFYKPLATVVNGTVTTYGSWQTNVWIARGNPNANLNDTVFKRGFVWVTDTAYFHDGFRFRFRNKATTLGDFDHWHVDYIYLDKQRSMIADTVYNDIAFGYTPSSLVKRYSSMPFYQYKPEDRADNMSVFIRNNSGGPILNMTYEYRLFNGPVETYSYTGNAFPNLKRFKYFGWSTYANHSFPAFSYTLPAFTDSIDYTVKHHLFTDGVNSDFFPGNDDLIQTQKFRNYYAYDDGSAEAAYYVNGVGGKMVQKFKLNFTDTLRAVRIYFDPIGNVPTIQTASFSIQIYTVSNGFPSLIPMLQDSAVNPKYLQKGVNVMPEYVLSSPVILSAGEYFIGVKQKVASGIGIGFDRNTNHMDQLYFDSGSGWQQSAIPGSLMINPVFRQGRIPVSLNELENISHAVSVFPNPANDQIHVQTNKDQKFTYRLLNVIGQTIAETSAESNEHHISTSEIANGIYFLTVMSDNKVIDTRKILVQH